MPPLDDGHESTNSIALEQTIDDAGTKTKQLFLSISLPCGRRVENRLVKVAMYEHLSDLFGGPPNAAHYQLYSRWSQGDWGMIITGNVQVSVDHLTLGRDMIVPTRLTPDAIEPYKRLSQCIHGNAGVGTENSSRSETLAIMQLSHAGRQSANLIGGRWPFAPPCAPSAVPMGRKMSNSSSSPALSQILHTLLFQTPREMSLTDIDSVVEAFVKGAHLAVQSGFDGVQLHAAHGYLISQFISPKTNLRADAYSVDRQPLKFLHRVVSAIRDCSVVPPDFVVGVKLNASDYSGLGKYDEKNDHSTVQEEQESRALQHIRDIASWGAVDFIEVSGGDYENPSFMMETRSTRQALFTRFAHHTVQSLCDQNPTTAPLILLTGGLRTLPLLTSALVQNHAHLLGIGRLSVLCPDLPRKISESIENSSMDFLAEPLPQPDLEGPEPVSSEQLIARTLEQLLVSILTYLWRIVPAEFPSLVGAGAEMAWYIISMRRIAAGREADYSIGGVGAVLRMWLWVSPGHWEYSGLLVGLFGVVIGYVVGILL